MILLGCRARAPRDADLLYRLLRVGQEAGAQLEGGEQGAGEAFVAALGHRPARTASYLDEAADDSDLEGI